jgi:mannose-6-phosphate isomerase-like protein (cupin superfamily)
MSSPQLVPPGTGAQVTAFGSTYTMKTDGIATAGAYSLVEEEFWGESTPLHRHTNAEEAFYVLSGEVAAWIDGAETLAKPGTFILVTRNREHGLRRVSPQPVRMLTLVSPPGLQGFFEAVAQIGEDQLVADPQRLVQLASEYGSEILGDYPGLAG